MKKLRSLGIICLLITSCYQPGSENTKSTDSLLSTIDTVNHNHKPPEPGNIDISDLKENKVFKDSDLYIKFSNFILQKTYIHDRYEGQWRYNSSERGNIFITCSILISSKSKDPSLPIICLFALDGKALRLKGTFDYNFSEWENYGTYLGNNADYGNDFAHTEKIRFDIGVEVDKNEIKDKQLYILAKNDACVIRNEDRFQEPAVKYDSESCVTGGDITSLDQLKNFVIVKIISQQSDRKKTAKNRNRYGGIDYGFIVSLPKNGKEPPQKKGYIAVTGKNRNGHDTVLYIKGEQ